MHNHPKATAHTTAYGSHLSTFVTAGNPQDISQTLPTQPEAPRNAKRNREGDTRTGTMDTSYAAMAISTSAKQSAEVNYGADVNNLLSRLEANLKTLDSIGEKQKKQDQALDGFELRFTKVEEGLQGHRKILDTLAATQEKQGKLMSSLNNKMDNLTHLISGEKSADTITQDLTALTQQTLASNPSQGAPEGMAP